MKPITVTNEFGEDIGRATVLTEGPGGVVVQMLLNQQANSIVTDPDHFHFQLQLKNGDYKNVRR